MVNFDRNSYVGKRIWLNPECSYRVIAKIVDVDSLGFTIKIIESDYTAYKAEFNYFISHTEGLIFQFMEN